MLESKMMGGGWVVGEGGIKKTGLPGDCVIGIWKLVNFV